MAGNLYWPLKIPAMHIAMASRSRSRSPRTPPLDDDFVQGLLLGRWVGEPLATRSVFASQRPIRRGARRRIKPPVDPLAGVKTPSATTSAEKAPSLSPFMRPSTDAEWREFHRENEEGMRRAYAAESGLHQEGGKLFVAGTRSFQDVADWPRIPLGTFAKSHIYQRAAAALEADPSISVVVGHSAGGSAALELARKYPDRGLVPITYNAPVFERADPNVWASGEHPLRFAISGDPVSAFDMNAATTMKAPDWNLGAVTSAAKAYTVPTPQNVLKTAQSNFDPLLGLHRMSGSYSEPSGPMDFLKSAAEGAAAGKIVGIF